jgi:hypothetical protein
MTGSSVNRKLKDNNFIISHLLRAFTFRMTTVYIHIFNQGSPNALLSGSLSATRALKLHTAEPSPPLSTKDPMLMYASALTYNIAEHVRRSTCHISIITPSKISFRAPWIRQLQTGIERHSCFSASASLRLNASRLPSMMPARRQPAKLKLEYAPLKSSSRMLKPSSLRDTYQTERYMCGIRRVGFSRPSVSTPQVAQPWLQVEATATLRDEGDQEHGCFSDLQPSYSSQSTAMSLGLLQR